MARSNRLIDKARRIGEPLETLIPRLIEEEGSIYRAAIALGVSPNSIQYWLRKNNLTVETRQAAQVVERKDGETQHG